MSREDKINKLKIKINDYLASGGNIQDKKKDIPYYNLLTDIIKLDKKNGVNSTIFSIYKECGYSYVSKGGKEVTISRLKEEIDNYVNNGGSIYDKKAKLPYYELMIRIIKKDKDLSVKKLYELCGYEYTNKVIPTSIERIKKEIDEYVKNGGVISNDKDNTPYYSTIMDFIRINKRRGISYNIEDIYKMCGYEYDGRVNITYKLNKIFQEVKDENGYIDLLKEIKKGQGIINGIRKKARHLDIDVNMYLMSTYGVRLSHVFSDIDYVSYVEEEIKKFIDVNGIDNLNLKYIHDIDKRLYNKINHLGIYFPGGSISNNDVLSFYGYNSNDKQRKKVNEVKVIHNLNKAYPDKIVSNLTLYPSLFYSIVRLSAENGVSVEDYLRSKGFSPIKGMPMYRLSKAILEENNEEYKKICSIRNKLMKESNVDFENGDSTKINDELEKIALKVRKIYSSSRRI